jgi:hypothetical protein
MVYTIKVEYMDAVEYEVEADDPDQANYMALQIFHRDHPNATVARVKASQ